MEESNQNEAFYCLFSAYFPGGHSNTWKSVCICMCACMCVDVCLYVCMYVYIHVYMCPYIYDFIIDFIFYFIIYLIFNYIMDFVINLTVIFELPDYHLVNLQVSTSWLQATISPYQQPTLWVVRQRALALHSTGVIV